MVTVALELNWNDFAQELTDDVRTALVRTINRVADRSRTRAAAAVREQVNFPASYLNPAQGRLTVFSRARKDFLEALLVGRDEATSLARFTKQKVGQKRGKGVDVQVKAGGRRKNIKRGFLINLRSGNVGLAVRTSGGEPDGAWLPKEIGKNLYLVYGPSVGQALASARDAGGVYEEITPEMLDLLESEFQRQLQLLRGNDG